MRSVELDVEGEIAIVGEQATIRPRRGSIILARVLGVERSETQEIVYLDRLVHERYHQTYCGYRPRGSISTILSREISPVDAATCPVVVSEDPAS